MTDRSFADGAIHPDEVLEPGVKVATPRGNGTISYRRMAPPDFRRVAAYSIRLDDQGITDGTTLVDFGRIREVVYKPEELTILPGQHRLLKEIDQ